MFYYMNISEPVPARIEINNKVYYLMTLIKLKIFGEYYCDIDKLRDTGRGSSGV